MAHVMFPKPLPGAYRLEQKRLHRERKAAEEAVMAEAKRRDHNRCRYPKCEFKDLRVECAHVIHRGMGGNPEGDRTQRHLLLALCIRHHHMFDKETSIDLEPVNPERGTDGPLRWFRTNPMTGELFNFYTEPLTYVSETRGQ